MIPRKAHHKGLRAKGKSSRSRERQQWQRELSAHWQERGMPNYCEAQFEMCINIFLTPAHSRDRFDIYTKDEFFHIIWACEKCHFHADREMPKDERLRIFTEIIENRS